MRKINYKRLLAIAGLMWVLVSVTLACEKEPMGPSPNDGHTNAISFSDELTNKGLDLNINQHQIIFGGGHGDVDYNHKTGEITLIKNYTGIMYHPDGQQLMSVGGVLTVNGNTQEVFDWSFVIDATQSDFVILTAVPNEGYAQIIIEENGETSFLFDGNAQFSGQGSQAIGFLELSYGTFYTTTLGVGFGIVQALTDIEPNFVPGGEDTPANEEDLDPGDEYEENEEAPEGEAELSNGN